MQGKFNLAVINQYVLKMGQHLTVMWTTVAELE